MFSKNKTKGQALILIAIAMAVLIAITGLAVDSGSAYAERRRAQNAADNAALAAGLAKIKGQDLAAAALLSAQQNGFAASQVTVNAPPSNNDCNPNDANPYAGNTEYVQVIIRSEQNTGFSGVIGRNNVQICTEAIARAKPGALVFPFEGYAVVALSQHAQNAFFVHGNAKAEVEGGVFVNSDDSTKAFFKNGSGQLEIDDKPMDIVGGYTITGGGTVKGTIRTGATQISPNNLPFQLPNPTCNTNATKSGNTMTPGNWTGTFPPAGVTSLNPGVYCINGNFILNGGDQLSGNGVVIYMISGEVRWNGNSAVNLHAPTTGPFDGLLLYLPPTNSSPVTINGNNKSCVEGSIIAPASAIAVLGNTGGGTNLCGDHPEEEEFEIEGQVIGSTVEMGGSIKTEIEYESSNKYQASTPPVLELTK